MELSFKAEDEERRRRNDELKLKIALERSVNEASPNANSSQVRSKKISYNLFVKFLLVIRFQYNFSVSRSNIL